MEAHVQGNLEGNPLFFRKLLIISFLGAWLLWGTDTMVAQAAGTPAPEESAQGTPSTIPSSQKGDAQGSGRDSRNKASLDWESGLGKSYLIPAIEVPSFLLLLNGFDRLAYSHDRQDGKKVYSSNLSTTWEHLRRQNWSYDEDPFNVNQFEHPYQGATMYGLARSTGLSFWESWAYSNAGSFLWKMAGETDPPSINDMITTGNAGSLLGEALFRMAGLVLEHGGGTPDTAHEVGAALLLPPLGLNRYLYGERFRNVFPSHHPATFWQIRLGESLDARINGFGSTFSSLRQSGAVDFLMSYGLPGEPGYTYRRPLDYFDFRITGLAELNNPVENVMLRGLLIGKDYQKGEDYRGIWGLYGSYDYFSPFAFRVSTTALSLGTTGQLWLVEGVALQGSVLGGVGFGAAGKTPAASGERDYHYGVAPQGILDLRLILYDRAMIDLGAREYYVSGTGSDDSKGSENIFRGNLGATLRVYRRHGIGVQYAASLRDAHYGTSPGRDQSESTVSIFYTYLSEQRLGAVRWR